MLRHYKRVRAEKKAWARYIRVCTSGDGGRGGDVPIGQDACADWGGQTDLTPGPFPMREGVEGDGGQA